MSPHKTCFLFTFIVFLSEMQASISEKVLRERSVPVAESIKVACSKYLSSKGFHNIRFATIIGGNENLLLFAEPCRDFLGGFYWGSTYAFTVPDYSGSTIFLSPSMIKSIEENLSSQKPISIYDKFTLLHELGHLYPYGRECAALESKLNLWTCVSIVCSAGTGLILAARDNGLITNQIAIKASICTLAACLCCTRTAQIIGQKVSFIKNNFKKWTFYHADESFEKHVKRRYEEFDADYFAISLLSSAELSELHSVLSTATDCIDKNAVHPTPRETCSMIIKELEKRK